MRSVYRDINIQIMWFAFMFIGLNGFYEEDHLVALFLGELTEFLYRLVSIALTAFGRASVPHDGLYHIACPTVVHAFRARSALLGQATSPQRSSPTPSCANIIFHEEPVLHHIGIGPYLLVWIARHIGIGEEKIRIMNLITARGPRGSVTCGTACLCEELLSCLEILGGGVACGRHSQSPVPYHQILILFGGHLHVQRFAGQIRLDVVLQITSMPFGMLFLWVYAIDIFCESCLNLRILG